MDPLKIIPPKGFEIDLDKSDYKTGEIHLKKIENIEKYNDICEKSFRHKKLYFIHTTGKIKSLSKYDDFIHNPNSSTTKEQLESVLNLNKLCNIAKYLNDGWLPDWNNTDLKKYIIIYDHNMRNFYIVYNTFRQNSSVFFKTSELAKKAIAILGEETIKSALTLNH